MRYFVRILIGMIASLAILSSVAFAEGGAQKIVNVNSEAGNAKLVGTIVDGIVMMPVSELAKSMQYNFNFSEKDLRGSITGKVTEVQLRLDNSVANCNGQNFIMSAPMKIISNRFMVPLESILQKMRCEYYFNAKNNGIEVLVPDGENKLGYVVVPGDTLWIISQAFKTTINGIKSLNNLSEDNIYPGQKLIIKNYSDEGRGFLSQNSTGANLRSGPGTGYAILTYLKGYSKFNIIGKIGEWYWVKYNDTYGYIYKYLVNIPQNVMDNALDSNYFKNVIAVDTSMDQVTYEYYVVKSGDSLWSIALKFGVTVDELIQSNVNVTNMNLKIGQTLKIPKHIIPQKQVEEGFGEVLDWFNEGQYVLPIGKAGKLTDLESGKSFNVKRTIGATHSDTEPLTYNDTQIMKEIFGGWKWNCKAFILDMDGRKFAVSVSGMPHAGLDGYAYMANVDNRSGNFGYGPNYDEIKGNGMDGHFDLYFLNSLRHKDNKIDSEHQYRVLAAGGLR